MVFVIFYGGFRHVGKLNGTSVSRTEITQLLLYFKKEIINNVATRLDTVKAKKKYEEVEAMLA